MPESSTLPRVSAHSPLALWHLLSLDAPTVATLWLVFVAHASHTALPLLLAPAMFLAVWLIYVADRLLDSTALEPRHHFHQRHRSAFLAGMVVAALVLSVLLFDLRLPVLFYPLAGGFVAYFAAVHLPRVPAAARLPKELATGLIFAGAIFAPELPRRWPEALAFALLCTVNCGWIHRWEATPSAHPGTRLLLRLLPQLSAALLLCGLLPDPVASAIAGAGAILLALNHYRRNLSPTILRAAADLALLTPLLVLPFLHAR